MGKDFYLFYLLTILKVLMAEIVKQPAG